MPHRWADLEAAVNAITGAGGIAVVAHPMRYGLSATARRALPAEFRGLGGRAVAVHGGSCSLGDRLNDALMAERFDLWASAGSDFHREGAYGAVLGACPELPPLCKPVWEYFREPFQAA